MKRLEQLKTLMRDLFGIVNPTLEVVDTPTGQIAVIDPWPLGTDKRLADKRLAALGYTLVSDTGLGPYSSAYKL